MDSSILRLYFMAPCRELPSRRSASSFRAFDKQARPAASSPIPSPTVTKAHAEKFRAVA